MFLCFLFVYYSINLSKSIMCIILILLSEFDLNIKTFFSILYSFFESIYIEESA